MGFCSANPQKNSGKGSATSTPPRRKHHSPAMGCRRRPAPGSRNPNAFVETKPKGWRPRRALRTVPALLATASLSAGQDAGPRKLVMGDGVEWHYVERGKPRPQHGPLADPSVVPAAPVRVRAVVRSHDRLDLV